MFKKLVLILALVCITFVSANAGLKAEVGGIVTSPVVIPPAGTTTTLSTSISQGAAGFFLSFYDTSLLSIGMIVTGTNIPANTIINQIGNYTSSVTTTASGSGVTNTVALTSVSYLSPWMIITDTTTPSAVGSQCTINALLSGNTILSGCSLANITSGDTLVFWPAVQLSNPTTSTTSSSASIAFQTNTTNLTAINANIKGDIVMGGAIYNSANKVFYTSIGTTNADSNYHFPYSSSVVIGVGALAKKTGEGNSVFIGGYAGNNITIQDNIYEYNSFNNLGYGMWNVAIGYGAMALGDNSACTSIAADSFDTAIGVNSLTNASCSYQDTAEGENSGARVTTSHGSTLIGDDDYGPTTGNYVTGLGYNVFGYSSNLTSGSNITALGALVGSSITTGNNIILVGTNSGVDVPVGTTSNYVDIANVIYANNIGTSGTSPAGQVSIGTSLPMSTEPLTLGPYGAQMGAGSNATSPSIFSPDSLNLWLSAATGAKLRFGINGTQIGSWDIGTLSVGSSGASGSGNGIADNKNLSIGASFFSTAAPSNGMIVQGNVGVGTATPFTGAVLSVQGGIAQTTVVSCTLGVTTNSVGLLNGCVSSDQRMKKNIELLSIAGLWSILNIDPVNYNWIDPDRDERTHAGFIAQNVEQYYPEGVSSSGSDRIGVDPNAMIALVFLGVRELLYFAIFICVLALFSIGYHIWHHFYFHRKKAED